MVRLHALYAALPDHKKQDYRLSDMVRRNTPTSSAISSLQVQCR